MAADVGGALVPFATGGGAAVRAITASTRTKVIGRIDDVSPYLNRRGMDVLDLPNSGQIGSSSCVFLGSDK